jgi:hypothetical protein
MGYSGRVDTSPAGVYQLAANASEVVANHGDNARWPEEKWNPVLYKDVLHPGWSEAAAGYFRLLYPSSIYG